jgi:hypothetical protein
VARRRAVVDKVAGVQQLAQTHKKVLAGVEVRHRRLLQDQTAQVGAVLVEKAAAGARVDVKEVQAFVGGRLGSAADQLTACCVAIVVQLAHLFCSVVPAHI